MDPETGVTWAPHILLCGALFQPVGIEKIRNDFHASLYNSPVVLADAPGSLSHCWVELK
jgi:hypothetical protein